MHKNYYHFKTSLIQTTFLDRKVQMQELLK